MRTEYRVGDLVVSVGGAVAVLLCRFEGDEGRCWAVRAIQPPWLVYIWEEEDIKCHAVGTEHPQLYLDEVVTVPQVGECTVVWSSHLDGHVYLRQPNGGLIGGVVEQGVKRRPPKRLLKLQLYMIGGTYAAYPANPKQYLPAELFNPVPVGSPFEVEVP
jgi:hypothetical protein